MLILHGYGKIIVARPQIAGRNAGGNMKYRLYSWQERCLKSWKKHKNHGIVHVVTGGGKTYLALAAAEQMMQQAGMARLRVKIVVPNASLLMQWAKAIRDYFDEMISRQDIGFCYGGRRDTPDRLFMIYVVNSARYSVARHIVKDFEDGFTVLLIADECHRYTGGENRKIFDFLPAAQAHPGQYASLGLSATPGLERPETAAVLIPALGGEIFQYGLKEAEEEKTLCPYVAFHIVLAFNAAERFEYEALSDQLARVYNTLTSRYPALRGGRSNFFFEVCQLAGGNGDCAGLARQYLKLSFKRKHLTSDAASRVRCVVKLIGLLDRTAKIIVFGERIEQANHLFDQLNLLYPNQTARYHSAMDAGARKLALERFRDGEVRILITCRALDEGFDVPSANVGIVMSSASANRQRIQRLGRILRRYEGKEIASLYYLYVKESSEEASYFPAEEQAALACELFYSQEEDAFYHPYYEAQRRRAMRKFRKKNPDSSLLSEAENCFDRGIVRPDWLLGEEFCRNKIDGAAAVSERNYWICMKQIAKGKNLNLKGGFAPARECKEK